MITRLETAELDDSRPDEAAEIRARLQEIGRALAEKPFRPHKVFKGSHAQTIAAYAWPRRRRLLRAYLQDEARFFEVEPGVKLLAHCRWQANPTSHPTLILVHGLEGSSGSAYMLGAADKAFRAGFNVVRLNMRNCGGTEHLTPTLYHSGMTEDFRSVLRELVTRDRLPKIFVAGFSMSGNMVLLMAGEDPSALPKEVAGIAAISPSVDLFACADAIARRSNWLYMQGYIVHLRHRLRAKKRLFPELYDTRPLKRVRTIKDFDELYTAKHGGFASAADYYARSSAISVIEQIRVPTLIIHAEDDPFIPFAPLSGNVCSNNPYILLLATKRGGHVGFLSSKTKGEDRFWVENRVIEFFRLLL